jgi:hypothetical protein
VVLIEIPNIYIFDNLQCLGTPSYAPRCIINQGFSILNRVCSHTKAEMLFSLKPISVQSIVSHIYKKQSNVEVDAAARIQIKDRRMKSSCETRSRRSRPTICSARRSRTSSTKKAKWQTNAR